MKMTSRPAGAYARLPVALGLAVAASLAHAAPADEARTLDTMVVTAAAPSSPLHWVTDPRLPRQPVPASDGADYLKTVPGFSAIRNGGTNGDPVLRGMFGSRLNILSNDGNLIGACPSRMDNPLSYIAPESFDRLTIIKGPQSVRWGAGASAGTVRFERDTPRFEEPGLRADASALVGSRNRLGLPFAVAALQEAVPLAQIAGVLGLTLAYLLFWACVAVLIAWRGWTSGTNAAALAMAWAVVALILPAVSNVVIERAIPVGQGAEIARAQREAVNHAWDIPREQTMQRFYANYPQWSHSAPLGAAFHYKWYLAFHQNGDDAVQPLANAYRKGIEGRASAAAALGWVLPPVGIQAALTRMAGTDMQAHLAYQGRVRAYHATLRQFYYGYLFEDRRFGEKDYRLAPAFMVAPAEASADHD